MKPSIGRKVHYVLPASSRRAGEHRSAEITGCPDGEYVNLTVMLDRVDDIDRFGSRENFIFLHRAWLVKHDESRQPGTWHVPEHVE
jgi:hypothetical protein